MLVHHLRTVHNKNPYECRCRAVFVSIGSALSHATTSKGCSSDDLVLNVIPAYASRNHVLSTLPSDSLSPTRSRSDCSPDSGVQVDLDEMEHDRTSIARGSTSVRGSDNETANIGSLPLPLFAAAASTATSVILPVDVSTILMALQLPLVPDYFAAMASVMNSPSFTPMLKTSAAYQCPHCAARFQDANGFMVHVRLHMAAATNLTSAISNSSQSHLPSFNQQMKREELLDIEK
uniref:C2H2-type domain-containing protein n=1 Tax=Angiostrongylus cantonensis TaxID=6313 RepID=A0A0K0DJH7_ANGCA